MVLFSGDDGVSWQPVAFDPPDGEVLVQAGRLPGGERCRFPPLPPPCCAPRKPDTEPFELALSGRRLHVWAPDDSCGIASGAVSLRAYVDTRGRGALMPHEVRWQSNLDAPGLDPVAQLSEGCHELTVTAPDGVGGTPSERAITIVSGRPQRAAH